MKNVSIKKLIDSMKEQGLRIVTAESLTCGMISATLANIPGASAVVNGGFSVYQDEVKTAFLGVPSEMLKEFTAVSRPVAEVMAFGALEKTNTRVLGDKASNISIAVTGYAGSPGGLSSEDDSGLVYIAIGSCFNMASSPNVTVYEHHFSGAREEVRQKTVDQALKYIVALTSNNLK